MPKPTTSASYTTRWDTSSKRKKRNVLELWSEGKCLIIGNKKAANDLRLWLDLPEREKQEAKRRTTFMRSVDELKEDLRRTPTKAEVCHELIKTAELKEIKKPDIRSYYRWRLTWKNTDGSMIAMAPNYSKCGNRTIQVDRAVVKLVEGIVNDELKHSIRMPLKKAYRLLVHKINEVNRHREETELLTHISQDTFNRIVKKVDQFEYVKSREGEAAARKKHGIYGGGPVTSEPNERWEIDHTSSDILIIDEFGIILGTPTITAAIDHYTRIIVGFDISFEAPNSASVGRCLKMAIMPKDNFLKKLKENVPGLRFVNPWPAEGRCLVLMCDNGSEFHGKYLDEGCTQLKIDLQYAPRRSPHLKGTIERWFRTNQEQFRHVVPGTTFSNYQKRGDYKSEKVAVISYQNFVASFTKYIVDIYNVQDHRAIFTSPLHKWETGVAQMESGIDYPESIEHVKASFGYIDERTLQAYGIDFFRLRYSSPELGTIRRRHRENLSVKITVDPEDIGTITVTDPDTLERLIVPCVSHPEYATGKSLWAHKMIRKHAKRENIHELAAAEAELLALVRKKTRPRGTGSRAGAANRDHTVQRVAGSHVVHNQNHRQSSSRPERSNTNLMGVAQKETKK